ncbi:hypothetical protein ACFLY1_00640 [Patescibacteria group bacterium]
MPEKSTIKWEDVFEGMIIGIGDETVQARIFTTDYDSREIQLPLEKFHGTAPKNGDEINCHVWELESGEIQSAFEIIALA